MKTLKNIFLTVCTLFLMQSCVVSEKPNMAFFSESGHDFKGAKFVSINVPLFLAKPYIKKALKEDGQDEELIRLVKKVSKIKVMTVENGDRTMLKDFANYLNDNNYEDWVTIKHDGDNVNIRVKQKGQTIKNMLITVNSDKELVFVDVKGNFTTDDISKMIASAKDK
jgi:CRISPR/Cas system CSM-associated protein Csm4 (group 5 of RAMP superfamily)